MGGDRHEWGLIGGNKRGWEGIVDVGGRQSIGMDEDS